MKKSIKKLDLRLSLESLENREMLSVNPVVAAQVADVTETAQYSDAVVTVDAISLATLEEEQGDEGTQGDQEEETKPEIDLTTVDFAYTQKTHSAVLSWDVVEGAENGYKVRIQKNGNWVDYRKGDKIVEGEDRVSCSITGLVPETTYNYQLIVLKANGTAETSVEYSVTIPADVPVEPVAPESIAWTYDYNSRTANLTWDPVEGADGYRVFVKKYDSQGEGYWVKYRDTDASTTQTVLKGIYAGKSYEFKVCAVDEKGASIQSDSFMVTPIKGGMTVTPNEGTYHTDGYRVGENITVTPTGLEEGTRYTVKWYMGADEITSAANQLQYAPTEHVAPITIVMRITSTGQEIVKQVAPAPVVDIDKVDLGYYNTPDRTLETFTFKAVAGASSYIVSRVSATTGTESTITSFHVDANGNITKNHKTRPASYYAPTQTYYFSVTMVDAGVDAGFSITAQDENGYKLDKVEISYAPVAVEFMGAGSYKPTGTEAERTLTVDATCGGETDDLTYTWYYYEERDWEFGYVVQGVTGNTYVVPEGTTGYYQVMARDADDNDYWTGMTAGATLSSPLVSHVYNSTDESGKTYLRFDFTNVDANATGVEIQYKASNGVWLNMTQTTIEDLGDGWYTCSRLNGQNYEEIRIRSYNNTEVSGWTTMDEMEYLEGIVVTTPNDVVDWTDGVVSLREALITRQKWADLGCISVDTPVTFDTTVFSAGDSCYLNGPLSTTTGDVYIDASNFVTVSTDTADKGIEVYNGQINLVQNAANAAIFTQEGGTFNVSGLSTSGGNHKFLVATESNVTVDKCSISGLSTQAITVTSGNLDVANTRIKNCVIASGAGVAIGTYSTQNVTIDGCVLTGNYMESKTHQGNAAYFEYASNVRIANSAIYNNGGAFTGGPSCTFYRHCTDIQISNVAFSGNHGSAIMANGYTSDEIIFGDRYGKIRLDQGTSFKQESVSIMNLTRYEVGDTVQKDYWSSLELGNTSITNVSGAVLDLLAEGFFEEV